MLLTRVGLTGPEVVGMSREEALDRLRTFWNEDA
jgi:hypothetical protein